MRRLIAFLMIATLPGLGGAHEVQSVRLVTLGGETEIQTTGADANAHTAFPLASVGKTMTAVAVLRLVEDGVLSFDESVTDWVPGDIADDFEVLEDVTLHHLLTMTSGLPDYYTDGFITDALDNPGQNLSASDALEYAMDEDSLFAPGTDFDYSNTNYLLLGMIAERATGQSYGAFMAEEVFAPAGMTSAFVFGTKALPQSVATGHEDGAHIRDYYTGTGFGDGGVIATAQDVERFYRALFRDRTLLGPDMMAALLRDGMGAGYGIGIEIEDGLVGHSGGDLGFSSDVRMDLDTGDIAIVLIGEADADTGWSLDQLDR